MILTDKEIRRRVEQDNLIEGFIEENLQSASYDITIGNKIQRFKNEFKRISLNDKKSIDEAYEEVDICYGYDLRPNEFVLVQLREKFNMPTDLTSHIRPRTSFIRLGLMLSAQHLNPTYQGFLHLGLHNASPYVIELRPNLIVGQIVFEELASTPSEYKWYKNKKNHKYQDEEGFTGSKIYNEVEIEADEAYKKLKEMIIGRHNQGEE